jgi:hypothetical protein
MIASLHGYGFVPFGITVSQLRVVAKWFVLPIFYLLNKECEGHNRGLAIFH